MKNFKKFKYYINLLIFILIIISILSVINLLFTLQPIINKVILLTSTMIFILIQNIKIGKRTEEKAYQKGLVKGLFTVLFLYLLSIITFSIKITTNRIIYYIIIILTCILGHVIGINKRNSNH